MERPPLESNIMAALAEVTLPPLHFRWLHDDKDNRQGDDASFIVEGCTYGVPPVRFWAKYKRQWTPKMVTSAASEAKQRAKQFGLLPLVVVPYLSEERLLELEEEGVSGLDLCGNGVIVVPNKVVVFRTGRPSRFTTSAPIKNVYRGTTSLIARAFLIRPTYASIADLTDFISIRGGSVSPATVSKALQGIEGDLVISRNSGVLRLLQPEKLLHLLEKNYVPVKATATVIGRVSLSLPELRKTLVEQAKAGQGTLAATGVSSAPRYTALAMEEQAALYCSNADVLLAGLPFEETNRFANLLLLQSGDTTAFFDVRLDEALYPWASPVQAYLEMVTGGDPRMKQSAKAVRESILNPLQGQGSKG